MHYKQYVMRLIRNNKNIGITKIIRIQGNFRYISFDKEGAERVQPSFLRAGRKSTIITTNLSFDRWSEIFGDPVLTAAMVDRLTHKAFLINMSGLSYRVKETKKWINN